VDEGEKDQKDEVLTTTITEERSGYGVGDCEGSSNKKRRQNGEEIRFLS